MEDPDFCCACLRASVMGDTFVSLNVVSLENISFKTKLMNCVPEMALEDADRSYLCKPCSVALETAYTFRSMCLRTEGRCKGFRKVHTSPIQTRSGVKKSTSDASSNTSVVSSTNSNKATPQYSYVTRQKGKRALNSKIETLKNELGNLLTESLQNTYNLSVLDDSVSVSKNSINNTVCKEPVETHTSSSKTYLEIFNTETISPEIKPLTDTHIIEKACKLLPELLNCAPESLNCKVALKKIVVKEPTVKLPPAEKQNVKRGKFWCYKCQRNLSRNQRFQTHMLRHSNIRPYKCKKCKSGFFSKEVLTKHTKMCTYTASSAVASGSSSIKSTSTIVASSSRNRNTSAKEKLPVKRMSVVKKKPRTSTKAIVKTVVNENSYFCDKCDFQTPLNARLKLHQLRRHSVVKPFKCLICPKTFYDIYALKRHTRETKCRKMRLSATATLKQTDTSVIITEKSNEDTKLPHISLPIIESFCSLASTSMKNEEIATVFPCTSCDLTFESKVLLQAHIKIHEDSHICRECNEGFQTSDSLLEHMETHGLIQITLPKDKVLSTCSVCNTVCLNTNEDISPETVYTCEGCIKNADDAVDDYNHSPVQNVTCEICFAKFNKKSDLYLHTCHNAAGLPVYRCQICEIVCVGRSRLIDHMHIHIS